MVWGLYVKQNCWEYFKCGREQDGAKARELGVCVAAAEGSANGIHHGKNGGRCCWAIAGTLCRGKAQGTFAEKHGACLRCSFYRTVTAEEAAKLVPLHSILERVAAHRR